MAAYWIARHTGKEVVFVLATRDMNKVAAQSLLLGADLLGLRNVVVLKGDEFKDGSTAARAVHDFRPTELIGSIVSMNRGADYRGRRLDSPTAFRVGAAIDLGRGVECEAALTRKKVEAGADFFLLQPLFDPQPIMDFLDVYAENYGEDLSAPVFCGVQVMAPGSVTFDMVPRWVSADMAKGRAGEDIAVQVVGGLVERGFRSIYLVPPIPHSGQRDYEAAQRVIESFKR